ncbi:MAG: hypothetical protein ACK4RF_02140 [Cyclobacteriaceae bacterium]
MKYLSLLLFICSSSLANAQTDENITKPPDTVQIGTYIISIHDINFQQKEYTIRFWLWLIYDNLQFDFAKQIDIPNAKTIEEPEVLLDMVDGKMWQLMKMKCVMKQNWKVGDFPFDKQRLVVHIENSIYDQNQLVFVADEFGSTFDRELTLDGWRIRDFKVSTNTHEYITVFGDPRSDMMHSEYASFNIQIDIERDAWGLFLKIFIGMYIAFLIAVLSFTPKATELEPRFGLPVGGLFAAVGNKYIIDSLLPESSSFTLVDTLHTITFLGIFVTLLISAIALRLYEKDKKEASARVDYWGSRIVVVLYILLNIAFVWFAEK